MHGKIYQGRNQSIINTDYRLGRPNNVPKIFLESKKYKSFVVLESVIVLCI